MNFVFVRFIMLTLLLVLSIPFTLTAQVIEVVEEEGRDDKSSFDHSTRYLFAPSAIPLKKGEGYYQNVMIGLNSVNVGITDNIAVAGGVEMITLLLSLDLEEPIVLGFVNAKYACQVAEHVHVGGGLLINGVISSGALFNENVANATAYGMVTLGNENTHFTASLGARMNNTGEFGSPVGAFSAAHRISNRVGLVTENWLIWDNRGSFSTLPAVHAGALRFFSDFIVVDMGVFFFGAHFDGDNATLLNGLSDFIPLPYLGCSIEF